MAPTRIRYGATERREQEDGNLAGKPYQSQQSGRARQPVHEP